MKIIIRKGPVSLELEINTDEPISTLQERIQEHIPVPPDQQVLSTTLQGIIVKLDPIRQISSYTLERPAIFYLEQLEKPKIQFSSPTTSIARLTTIGNTFDNWVLRAVKYCTENNFEKFSRLKDEFSYTTMCTLNEKSFKDLINATVDQGWNCLHFVCKNGHSGILQMLLNCGAEYNLETEDGWTPLSLASFYGYIICAEILLNQAAIQVNKQTDLKGTALHQACLGGNTKVVKLLMDSQASPYIEDSRGLIPLQLCTKQAILEMIPKYIGVEFLNKYTKEVNKPSNHSGEMFWTASWQINDKLVVMALNVESGVIVHYNKKLSFLLERKPDVQIPITEVQDVTSLEEISLENKYFIHIRTLKDTYKYYSKHVDVTLLWVQKIRTAVKYYQEHATDSIKNTYRQSKLFSIFYFDALNMEESDEEDEKESVSFASFEILEEIGVGSFGKVFKVLKKNTGKRYAMKVVNKSELKRNNQLKYVIAECKILKRISCPFIIPLYWAFQTPNNIYMIFEYCPHGDLSSQIKPNGLSEDISKRYISEIVLAIEYLHSINIIYRDLKPQNVLIDEECHLKLADFGLARENIDKINPATTFCGSPGYLAPEFLSSAGVWKPADIYSLGVCLYEMLAGKLPFESKNTQKLYKNILNNKIGFPATVSANAKNLILALMNKNPEKRMSIGEVKGHAFFGDVDWDKLGRKEVEPPVWIEEKENETDLAYFEDRDYSHVKDQLVNSRIEI